MLQVLQLLEAPHGPVLVDFPDDAPAGQDEPAALVCPVPLNVPPADLQGSALLRAALQQEVGQLRPWYDLAVSQRQRSTFGVAGLSPDDLVTFVGAFLEETEPDNPRPEMPLAALLRFAVEDLKTYYCEAITAQPGQQGLSSQALADWFWRQTTAGRVLFAVYEVCKRSTVPGLQVVATGFLIPRARAAESPYASA